MSALPGKEQLFKSFGRVRIWPCHTIREGAPAGSADILSADLLSRLKAAHFLSARSTRVYTSSQRADTSEAR